VYNYFFSIFRKKILGKTYSGMIYKLVLLLFLPMIFSISVDKLHPSNIQCFGVIGDSVSAGFSLESHSILRDLFEYRGKSFPIGGENGFRTIPNIFSLYGSPKKCASIGSTFITYSLKQYPTSNKAAYEMFVHPTLISSSKDLVSLNNSIANIYEKKEINCNVAISGALSHQTMQMWNNLQIEWKKQDCQNEWKLLTIMIGANDICQYCLNGYNNTIYSYIFNLAQLFSNIVQQSQNMFVNVISTFNVALTADWQNRGCDLVHQLINECPCILGRDKTSDYKEVVEKLYKDINLLLYPLVENYSKTGFAKNIKFVIQPIIEDFKIYNSSYLSSLDCFHPSEFGHHCMATLLWNNMFLPPNKKMRNLPNMVPLYVPTKDDYLQ